MNSISSQPISVQDTPMGKVRHNTRPYVSWREAKRLVFMPPSPHDKRTAPSIPLQGGRAVSGERLTRKGERGTLFLAISHIARGMLYLCKRKDPPHPVRASNWKVLPSRGTEAHSVLLLKTSLAPYGRESSTTDNVATSAGHYTPRPIGRGKGEGPTL